MPRSTNLLANLRNLSFAFAVSAALNGATAFAAPADSASTASTAVGPALLSGVSNLVPAVPQDQQDGNTTLGLLTAPLLPDFLTGAGIPLPQGFPWGLSNLQTNPYTTPPNTGVVKNYDFTITNKTLKPDGVSRSMLVINGQFPGPTIEANWGDTVQVTVHNGLSTEGVALHWHGFLQKGTPWEDGVPGVGQCPIAPGSSFTYRFKADLFGSSWYHSHYSAQYNAGLSGAMVIHGPKNANYDIDLGPVMLSDWYHADYFKIVEQVMDAKQGPPSSQNNLINGKMNFPCATTTLPCTPNAGISKFKFQSGKTHRLRLINSGSEGTQQFSIDNHQFTVIANDFVPVQPYPAKIITLGIGQRTDVIVKATGKPTDSYFMRANLNPAAGCSINNGTSQAVAAVYYEKASTTAVPTTTMDVALPNNCTQNDPLSQSIPFKAIAPQALTKTIDYNITFPESGNKTSNLFDVNNQTFRVDYNDPTLLEAKLGNLTFDPERNVYNVGNKGSVRFIVRNFFPAAHPMHMHGHNFYILAEGSGEWDGTITRPNNPQRRDVQLVRGGSTTAPGYIIVQFDLDNPGVWPFHCHIAWHVSAGLYINILERPNDITFQQIPSVMAQTCRDWSAYTKTHIPDQIDSGL